VEGIVGSDPQDNCGNNAWPPDSDTVSGVVGVGNTVINNLDMIPVLSNWLYECT